MEGRWFKRFLIFQPVQRTPTQFDFWLLVITLTVLLFVPSIPVSDTFHFSLEEIFVGIIGVRLLKVGFVWIDRFVAAMMAFAVLVLFTILINPHRTEVREYFEIYKFIKIATIYAFSVYLFLGMKRPKRVISFVNFSFFGLVIFNLLHYFDVWNFNEHITILYDSDQRDTLSFGLNSLGLPSTKRMIGTMGNPNVNAILFLFYFAFYQARITILKPDNKFFFAYKVLFVMATLMVLLCQSRTGILIGGVVYVIGLFQRKLTKDVIYELALIGAAVLIMLGINAASLKYLTNTKINLVENGAVMGRVEIAKQLLREWTTKPIFGFGPNKTYMYTHRIYPENGYIFHLWRYGIFGLGLYCFTLWYLVVKFYREKVNMPLFLFVIAVFSIGGLTNLPLMNPKFSFIFAILAGFATCQFIRQKTKLYESTAEGQA